MLDTQYRMHPLICGFISRAFYGGKLADAPDMAEKTAAPWHAASCLGPFAFFDVSGAPQHKGNCASNPQFFLDLKCTFDWLCKPRNT